ncbi:formylglycine-generating enzyme family protein [Desulfoluna spongiiphila]|uniref:formylglycine-generating enzyme family protein n=1 Tax=Desulfoluna spongiiphila TaxID=419481 RepID=UPI0015878B60|nr:formylglycine-generating enzyme family protein [Desulfoluna spongiiphila]
MLLLMILWAPVCLRADAPLPLSEQEILEAVGMPEGTFLGHASEEQARKLAALLCNHHNSAMEHLADIKDAQKIPETKRLIRENLIVAERILNLMEKTATRQGTGELTLFYDTGADTFAEDSLQHRRLVRFLDFLARESKGRPLLFISIGSASAPGTEKENLALSARRAHFPRRFIEHYLVNTPHGFYEIYGTGEAASPENGPDERHRRHQHTRLIAFYAKKAPQPVVATGPKAQPDIPDAQGPAEVPSEAKASRGPEPAGQHTGPLPGMGFAWIPPGTFTMGSPRNEPGRDSDETPHQVTLSRGYYMQVTEVTQGQWDTLMETNPSYYKECGADCPVNRVCWTDVMEFVRRLNAMEDAEGFFRLPTEAEWEYACRAGSQEAFSNGPLLELACAYDTNLDRMGWYIGNSNTRLQEVGQKAKNSWGLYDMHGNIWEWCLDWEGPYGDQPRTDPSGPPTGDFKIIRGGSWSSDDRDCRSANRLFVTECNRNAGIGFRLVMEK